VGVCRFPCKAGGLERRRFFGWFDCKVKAIKQQRQIFCSEDKELTKTEYVRLLNAASQKKNDRLNLILQTICGTGIRVSELEFITVEAAKVGQATVNCKGKIRAVFIVKDLKKKLLQYAKARHISTGPIFITRGGKPISRTNIWREMKALCKDANVNPNKVFPHNLRHLFGKGYREARRHSRSQQHQHHADLYHLHRRRAPQKDGEYAAGCVRT